MTDLVRHGILASDFMHLKRYDPVDSQDSLNKILK